MAGLGVKAAICASFNFSEPVNWFNQIQENVSNDLRFAIIYQAKLNAFCEEISTGKLVENIS